MSSLQRRRSSRAGRRPTAAILHGVVPADAPADEQDVLVEVATVAEGLAGLGYDPVAVPFGLDLTAATRRLKALKPAFVFNLVESVEGQGRFVHLAPTLLDSLGLPYTGAGAAATFLTAGKPLAKRIMRTAGIPTPPWIEAAHEQPVFAGPYIVKSVWEHASIGLDAASIVTDAAGLPAVFADRRERFGGDWFAERFIDGREFNLGLLGGEVLPVAEMTFVDFPPEAPRIVDYAAKWDPAAFSYHQTVRRFDLPASDRPLLRQLEQTAKDCWALFGLTGYARVDFRVDGNGRPWVLEINTNPCISPDGGFFAAASRAGLSLTDLMRRILAAMPAPPRVPAALAAPPPQSLPVTA
jgi:D-alanine-D-alanine ligase